MANNNKYNKTSNKSNARKRNNYRGQKSYRNEDKDKEMKKETSEANTSSVCKYGTNEPSWYNRQSRLVDDATKVTMANQLGRPIKFDTPLPSWVTGATANTPKDYIVPGIMSFKMINTPGIAQDANDGVNLAASMLFQKMRQNISTIANYSAADVMIYALGIDEIYSQYANLTRLFGMLNAYSAFNLYYPKAVVGAAYGFTGVEVERILHNFNDYRARFNNLIFKASSLYLPTDFSIVARHAWIYSNYFMDKSGLKSQIYVHRKFGSYKLNETLSKNGTALEYIQTPNTLEEMLDLFATCIEVYRSSDSMLRIAADMRRAYETSNAWALNYVDEAYIIVPLPVDDHVRSQIHNMDIYPTDAYLKVPKLPASPDAPVGGTLSIGQDVNKNIVVYNPIYTGKKSEWTTSFGDRWLPLLGNKVLDFNKEEVTSDDILEATRNTWRAYLTDSGDEFRLGIAACGADLCVGVDMCSLKPDATGVDTIYLRSNLVTADEATEKLPCLEVFDGAPYVMVAKADGTGSVPFCEFDNYTTLDPQVVTTINNVVMTSMWSVPAQFSM